MAGGARTGQNWRPPRGSGAMRTREPNLFGHANRQGKRGGGRSVARAHATKEERPRSQHPVRLIQSHCAWVLPILLGTTDEDSSGKSVARGPLLFERRVGHRYPGREGSGPALPRSCSPEPGAPPVATMAKAWTRRNWDQVGPIRRGAGPDRLGGARWRWSWRRPRA